MQSSRIHWILRGFAPLNDESPLRLPESRRDDGSSHSSSYASNPVSFTQKTDHLFSHQYIRIFLNMEKKSYTYILFSQRNGTLYVGVTNNIKRRVTEHKEKLFPGFTSRYRVDKLGYFEEYNDIRLAIQREKELKGWSRNKKITLIESTNPHWNDLFYELQ